MCEWNLGSLLCRNLLHLLLVFARKSNFWNFADKIRNVHAIYPVKFSSVLHRDEACILSKLRETTGTQPREDCARFFSPRWNRISTGGLEREHLTGNKRSRPVSRAVEGKIFFPRLFPFFPFFFFFFFILFSGCAHPFARIDRKLLDQKQTPTGGEGWFVLDRGDSRSETDRARKMASEKLEGGQDTRGWLRRFEERQKGRRMWIDSRKDEKRRYAYLSWDKLRDYTIRVV